MNKIYKILAVVICGLSFISVLHAQEQPESLRDRIAKRQQQQQGNTQQNNNGPKVPQLSVRAEMMNDTQTQDLSNATWIREVYRFLDLTKGKNAALYYPVQPIGNQMNFYTMIFKLMGDGNLVAYDWNNGTDLFVDNLKINFGDVLERLEIPYQKNGNAYSYDEFSIPSNEALGYYIKEAWYFDQSNSVLGVKIVAICPVLFRQQYVDGIDFGTSTNQGLKEPQFWIPYENIRPYAARMPIMASDKNNVMNKTIDDYFRMRLYEGEIYKTTNMENKFLNQIYTTPETLKEAQNKIEGELKEFDKELWIVNDSINQIQSGNTKNTKKSNYKAPKTKKAKSTSAISYSARDRR
ncbi:gliding motility protein GldN [Dysgonomonas mossii]|uniref:Gliding motility protein GldN n=1 Tax=Dysgonomonas mossii TaxID=163665 RepID=A0A4Y9IMV3_9BACT|nr:gliding motility protein GldN [Dysgonomonas mossii]MBF0760927.1 gliding motility protein GldN [Dysgonomonas mossii]TFU89887.1 gliding motility protein GldN [Dysgonomonas mossii]